MQAGFFCLLMLLVCLEVVIKEHESTVNGRVCLPDKALHRAGVDSRRGLGKGFRLCMVIAGSDVASRGYFLRRVQAE
jgi:hypothetical protein